MVGVGCWVGVAVAVAVAVGVGVVDSPDPPHSTISCGVFEEFSFELTLKASDESPIITKVKRPLPLICAVTSISIHVPVDSAPRFAKAGPAWGIVFHVIPVSDQEVSLLMEICGPLFEPSRTYNRNVALETGLPTSWTLKRM